MAGLETQHKIVETIEVKGIDKALGNLDNFGKSIELNFGKALDKVPGKLTKIAKQFAFFGADLINIPKAAGKAWEGLKGKFPKVSEFGSKIKDAFNFLAPMKLVNDAIEKGIQLVKDFIGRWKQLNMEFESAQGRVQGLLLGLIDWKKSGVPAVKEIETSLKATNILVERFTKIGIETATGPAQIEAAYARLNSVLSGTGRNQQEILKFTRLSAAAAKIYGDNAEVAGGIVSKAIFEGVVEGESAFAKALKAQAQVTSKMKLEERIKRVTKVLDKMSGPLSVVTTDTESMMTRLRIISEDILQRVTYPIWQKIGQITGNIVAWFKENERTMNALVTEGQEWVDTLFEVAGVVWDVVKGFGLFLVKGTKFVELLKLGWHSISFIRKVVGAAALGFRSIVAGIHAAVDPKTGMGAFLTYANAVKIRFYEIGQQLVRMVRAFARVALPDIWVENSETLTKFFKSLKDVEGTLGGDIKRLGKEQRIREKKHGMGTTTAITRELERAELGIGLSESFGDALLKSLKGAKIQQKIGPVNIRQDFKDQDPDRVLVEFVTDLERLGEAAIQSTAGGFGTVFEGGGY